MQNEIIRPEATYNGILTDYDLGMNAYEIAEKYVMAVEEVAKIIDSANEKGDLMPKTGDLAEQAAAQPEAPQVALSSSTGSKATAK